MKSVPTSERLVAKRSHVHGWGLFVKLPVVRNDMIVEYMGETVRGPVADLRERLYEEQRVGSCYLFRLDRSEIVDATRKGGMARFINHSCAPNAYAKVTAQFSTLRANQKKIDKLISCSRFSLSFPFRKKCLPFPLPCGSRLCKLKAERKR